MKLLIHRLLASMATALLLPACHPSVSPEPAPATSPAAKEEYKKPVRMNGRGEVTSISFDQFYVLQEAGTALVFDARLPAFYHLGHIPGAINLPLPNCDTNIHKREAEIKAALAQGKTIVVYCSGPGCMDARGVARHLSGFGFPARVFSGGWQAWSSTGI